MATARHPRRTATKRTSEPAAPARRTRFPKRLFGYRRRAVDEWAAQVERELVELRQELLDSGDAILDLSEQLEQAQTRIRFHEDREAFVREEFERASAEARRIVEDARERAREIETSAEQRALRLVDRVCDEANVILQHARDEARRIGERGEAELARVRSESGDVLSLQLELQRAVRAAMQNFDEGLRQLEHTTPSRARGRSGSSPTFGRDKAIAAVAGGTDSAPDPAAATFRLLAAAPDDQG